MVISLEALARILAHTVLAAAGGTSTSIGPLMRDEGLPWYDPSTERLVPVLPWPDWYTGWTKSISDWISARWDEIKGFFNFLNGWRLPFNLAGVGDLIAIGLVMLILTGVLVLLLELLRRYRPVSADLPHPRGQSFRARQGGLRGCPPEWAWM